MNLVCTNNPKHKKFIASGALQLHDWVIDKEGSFLKDLGCQTVVEDPDPDNGYICKTCGAVAVDE